MIILDTNVLSALMRQQPDPPVVTWLDRQSAESIWISSVTLFEAHFGLALLPQGRRKDLLLGKFDQLLQALNNRVLLFDAAAALLAAKLAASRRSAGRVVDMRDTFIAGIALARGATLATRNTRHFHDLSVVVVDPWTSA